MLKLANSQIFSVLSLKTRLISGTALQRGLFQKLKASTKDLFNQSSPIVQSDWVDKHLESFFDLEAAFKTKNMYMEAIRSYEEAYPQRQYLVEFIYAALSKIKEYHVHHDYQVYEKLLKLFPDDGRFRAANMIIADMHCYPKQQQAATIILQHMELERLIPSQEISDHLVKVFGNWTQRFSVGDTFRPIIAMYWQPKMSQINKFSPSVTKRRFPAEIEALQNFPELLKAFEALDKMCSSVDSTVKFDLVRLKSDDDDHKSWLMCAQSQTQRNALKTALGNADQDPNARVWLEGPQLLWLNREPIHYFVLKSTLAGQEKTGLHNFLDSLPDFKSINESRKIEAMNHLFMSRDLTKLNEDEWSNKHVQQSPNCSQQTETICSTCVFGGADPDAIIAGKSSHIADWLDHLEGNSGKSDRIYSIDHQK